MKKYIPLIILLLGFSTHDAHATIWRVSNRSLDTDADTSSLQGAINVLASAGDTIYVTGSTTSYGSITVSKRLTIIGPGYWLTVNDTTQAYTQPATIDDISFNSGSKGSVIMGMKINNTSALQAVYITDDNITVKKNRILSANGSYSYDRCVFVSGARDSVFIEQNWIENTNDGRAVEFNNGATTNCKVNNNFLKVNDVSTYYALFNWGFAHQDFTFANNVIRGILYTYNVHHVNNILMEGDYYAGTNDVTNNNLCNGTQYPAGNGNQQNVDMSTVFVDYTSTVDSGYVLASGSPAIGAGAGGGDCGMFGNTTTGTPYVLSGLPPVPAIFEADVTKIGVATLPVTIKIKAHNTGK